MRGDEDTKAELHQQLDVCNISRHICIVLARFSPQFGCTVEATGFNVISIITITLCVAPPKMFYNWYRI